MAARADVTVGARADAWSGCRVWRFAVVVEKLQAIISRTRRPCRASSPAVSGVITGRRRTAQFETFPARTRGRPVSASAAYTWRNPANTVSGTTIPCSAQDRRHQNPAAPGLRTAGRLSCTREPAAGSLLVQACCCRRPSDGPSHSAAVLCVAAAPRRPRPAPSRRATAVLPRPSGPSGAPPWAPPRTTMRARRGT